VNHLVQTAVKDEALQVFSPLWLWSGKMLTHTYNMEAIPLLSVS